MFQAQKKDCIAAIALVLAAALCVFFLSGVLSNPETYDRLYASIDAKTDDVLALTAASAVASTAITAIPDDVGTPIANQIAEFSNYLLIVLSVLLTEKYLINLLGLLVFRFLIPAALLAAIPFLPKKFGALWEILKKIAILGLALYLVIPVSMNISDRIGNTFDVSVKPIIESIEQLSVSTEEPAEESASFWDKITGTVDAITDHVSDLPQKASQVVNQFMAAIAVMIVTSCVIPLLVLLLALWIIKLISGADIHPNRHRRQLPAPSEEDDEALVSV